MNERPEAARQRLHELAGSALEILTKDRPGAAVDDLAVVLEAADPEASPWGTLVVAVALGDERPDDPAAATLIDAVHSRFEALGDRRGQGFAVWAKATLALGRGRLAELADLAIEAGRLLADDEAFPTTVLTDQSIAAYSAGSADDAVVLAERALALARSRNEKRSEVVALIYLAFFSLWNGAFTRVETLLDSAEAAYEPSRDRHHEFPMIHAVRGVIAALRQRWPAAEAYLDFAIAEADHARVPWWAAMARTLRAEFLAERDPARAVEEARRAYATLVDLGDHWWANSALRAQGVATRAAGQLVTSRELLEGLLDRNLPGPEGVLTVLALAETLSRTDSEAARAMAERALAQADAGRFAYLEAWALSLLAGLDKERAADLYERVRRMDDGDPAFDRFYASGLRVTMLGDPGVWRDDERIKFATRHAELTVYCLALSSGDGIHQEDLAERLWPGAPADKIKQRLATLVWQVRRALGPDAWRIRRDGPVFAADFRAVDIDLVELRRRARALLATSDPGTELDDVIARLGRPLLPQYRYDEWLAPELDTNQRLLTQLTRLAGHYN